MGEEGATIYVTSVIDEYGICILTAVCRIFCFACPPHSDFGSAKCLVRGEPNVSYICSRYYRAPELVFEATEYTTAIDTWSVGCVFAELLLGAPLFPGESGVGQLIEIIKVLGSPTKEEVLAMNPSHTACLALDTMVRMADGTTRAAEKLHVGSELLSTTGGTTQIVDLAVVNEPEDMVTVQYTLNGASLTHKVTASHLVTLRCPASPTFELADGELSIEWFDAKTISKGYVNFRITDSNLSTDLSSHNARAFGEHWLREQTNVGSIHPLYKGDLFEVEASKLTELMKLEDVDQYVNEVIANLGLPICSSNESDGHQSASVQHEKTPSKTIDRLSIDDVLASFRALRLKSSSSVSVSPSSVVTASPSMMSVDQEAGKPNAKVIHSSPACDGVAYQPMSNENVKIVYMLPNPVSSNFGESVNGGKSYTFQQMEGAWKQVMDVTQSNLFALGDAIITELNPTIAPIEEFDSRDAQYKDVCFQSIASVVSLRPESAVTFGIVARDRWIEYAKESDEVASFDLLRPDDRVMRLEIVLKDGHAMTVYFAPHPACQWKQDDMAMAMAEAHGLLTADVASKLAFGITTHARLTGAVSSGKGAFVTFSVDSQDHRYVLADSVITHNSFKFPAIKPQPWSKVFKGKAGEKALDLISKWLRYKPLERTPPLESLAHPFFDELREPGLKLPNGRPLPPLFNFTDKELKLIEQKGLTKKLIPSWYVPTQQPSQHISMAAQNAALAAAAANGNKQ